MSQIGLSWSELFRLPVVKKMRSMVHARWRLGMGYLDVAANDVQPPRFHEAASGGRGVCQVIHEREPGEAACRSTAHAALARLLAEPASQRPLDRPFTIVCHAGLSEIVAPIVVHEQCIGALTCGGFFRRQHDAVAGEEAAALAVLDARARQLGIVPGDHGAARDGQPRLDDREIMFVSELMQAAAEEIAAYHGQALLARAGAQPAPGAHEARDSYADGAIRGKARPMQELYALLDRVVKSDTTVLIEGENGTGKELVAHAIHQGSGRRKQRFVVINCSAFNDNLLDSELFGHKRGAFTGAIADKQGLFELADRGTFFLDEIGDMSPSLQVKVLRVLQEGTFMPVGDTEMRKVDVRIITATNRDLGAMVASGQFREDLYYRINVINLRIPPLRERREDIELLVDHFLTKHTRTGAPKTLAPACMQRLVRHDWPGNVRELENEIARLIVLAGDERVIAESLISERIRHASSTGDAASERSPGWSLPQAVRQLERRMILEALGRNGWNKTRASAELEISRRNLIRLVQKYGLESERTDR